jgi:uncharacterized repeat protein (TIGR01451 family)
MKGEKLMASAEKYLGEDLVGISAKCRIEDEIIGAQETTTYTLSITNNSKANATNVKIDVTKAAGTEVVLHPPHLKILVLRPGETKNRVFLVHNPTNDAVTKYTLQNRISYAEAESESDGDFGEFTRS